MVSMRAARDEAFRRAGIPADGGDSEPWVDFKLGPIPMPFPNTDARRRTVKFHDLHHVLTGYRTDIFGEFEISAWELGAGCGRFGVAWGLNLLALAGGLLSSPGRTVRAFWRGRRSDSLYTTPTYDEVIDQPVDEVRRWLRVPGEAEPVSPTASDVLHLGAASLAGFVLGVATLAIILTPVTLAAWVLSYSAYRREVARRSA
ncbi:MAG: hypothetical protein Q8N26_14785 [Myxococcales bacterium]|nr:hypothetical protein [Myxococcales bacterium]